MFLAPALRTAVRSSPVATRSLHTSAPALLPKRKKDKEPKVDKPKRPPTVYNLFVKKTFAELKAQNPNAEATDLMKEIARRWQTSPENAKNQ